MAWRIIEIPEKRDHDGEIRERAQDVVRNWWAEQGCGVLPTEWPRAGVADLSKLVERVAEFGVKTRNEAMETLEEAIEAVREDDLTDSELVGISIVLTHSPPTNEGVRDDGAGEAAHVPDPDETGGADARVL